MSILDHMMTTSTELDTVSSEESQGGAVELPSFMVAANLHNQATGNDGIIGGIGTWIAGIGESVKNAPKWWGLAAASGAVGVANTGIAIANLVTNEDSKIQELDLKKWVTEYDSDLGRYYRENATGIDTAGFVISSIVPGSLGVKALNVGQKALRVAEASGALGVNMSRATGLLVPRTEAYIAQAAKQLAATNLQFSRVEANALKALGSGFQQNVLEAAAFETAALAANFKSNYISEMSAGDIALNLATGVLLGGAIGGVLGGAKIYRGIRNQTEALDSVGVAGITQVTLPDNVPIAARNAQNALNREGVEQFIAKNEVGPEPGAMLPDGRTLEIVNHQVGNAKRTVDDINNKMRTGIREISPAGDDVGNAFADHIIKLPSREAANLTLGAEQLVRTGDVAIPQVGKVIRGQQNLTLEGATPISDSATSGIQWSKLWGSRAGGVFDEQPVVTQIADRVKLSGKQTLKDKVEEITKSFRHQQKRPLDVMGSRANLNEVQSRYLAASRFKLKGPQAISESDIPVLEAAYNQFDSIGRVDLVNVKGNVTNVAASKDELLNMITSAKDKVIERGKARGLSADEVAERANVKEGFIDGTEVAGDQVTNYFARQSYAKELGVSTEDMFYRPSYMGVKQDQGIVAALTEHALDAETLIATMHKAAQSTIDNAVASAASYLGQSQITDKATGAIATKNMSELFLANSEFQGLITGASRFGSGARLFTFANGSYGSLESAVQYLGRVKESMDRTGIDTVKTAFSGAMRNIRTSVAASTELSMINEQLARMPVRYGLNTESKTLVPLVHLDDAAAGVPLRQLDPGVLPSIPIKDPSVFEVVTQHITLNGKRTAGRAELRASLGSEYHADPRAFYPIKPSPKDVPFFAFVVDDTITGAGRSTMIHAGSSAQLAQMMWEIESQFPKYKLVTSKTSEDYHKALGDYEYSKTMNEDYIDTSLKSKGINSQFFPQTDGNLVAGKFESWHNRQTSAYNAEIMSTKYQAEFGALEALGREFESLSQARYPDFQSMAMNTKNNPYVEYAKTALNISNMSDYGWLSATNKALDSTVSKVWNVAAAKMKEIRGVKQGELDTINKVFEEGGFKTAYYDAATHLLANHPADQAVLSRFIRGANSLLATSFLRLDHFNAINNNIGSLILTSTETRHLIDGIKKANPEIAGKLAKISDVQVPGTSDSILSANRLMMRSYQNFFKDKALVQQAIDQGIVPKDISRAFEVLDTLTLNGTESAKQLTGKLEKAFDGVKSMVDFGEKWTGNKIVESMNRFVSYDVMRQITDVAVEGGIISQREALSYINTFVNRTQVNLMATQRPLVFQGPIGMAMGLFQSYQFNLIQQLFRYVGDGSRKTAGFMMGMQGSMYGLNGLPGYSAFNEHIIGQAAGNYEHNDVTSMVRDAAGSQVANFLLYGAPSNLLQANLYSRGDLTPHNPTILPSSIGDIAAVSMYGKFFGNLSTTLSNVANGADIWKSILTGLEHNSVSRPLAGLAQTLRGFGNGSVYSTDNRGNVLSSNDLASLSTLARLAGGKPIDEAIVRDERWRISMYRQADLARRTRAAEALRVSLADSGAAPSAQMDKVFDVYLNTGGKSADFNKWFMQQYKKANVSEADKMRNSLNDPYSQRMQQLMGGATGVDFSM